MASAAPPALSTAVLFGVSVCFEQVDALAEAGRLWPVTLQLASFVATEFAPPASLRGKTVVEVGSLRASACGVQ
jgi:hypothetical protein